MHRFKHRRLGLNHKEQDGFLLLCLVLLLWLVLTSILSKSSGGRILLHTIEIEQWRCTRDSINRIETLAKNKIRPFNPNFISAVKADRLGLTLTQLQNYRAYRKTGRWINSVDEFKAITGVDAQWIQEHAPLFRFPDWINQSKSSAVQRGPVKPLIGATLEALIEIPGIYPSLAKRILKANRRWGGFGSEQELLLVYGMKPALVSELKKAFTLEKKIIKRRNINSLHVTELTEIPGLHFDLAKDIWEFVRLRQGIKSLQELRGLDQLDTRLFYLIQLYLYAMKNEPDGR